MINSTLLRKLLKGEGVICPTCKIGVFKPFSIDVPANKNHTFICSNCGERILLDIRVTVE